MSSVRKEEAIKCYDNALEILPKDEFVLECKRKIHDKFGISSWNFYSKENLELPPIKRLALYEIRACHSLGLSEEESTAMWKNFGSLSNEELIEKANVFLPSIMINTVQFSKLQKGLRNFGEPIMVQKYVHKIDEKINSYDFFKMIQDLKIK